MPLLLLGVRAVLEDVARGAIEGAADGVEGREAHGLGLASLQDREKEATPLMCLLPADEKSPGKLEFPRLNTGI